MNILKHAGTLGHDELLREVVLRLRGHFEPSVTQIRVSLRGSVGVAGKGRCQQLRVDDVIIMVYCVLQPMAGLIYEKVVNSESSNKINSTISLNV